jgi:hypothetical protein
LDAALAGARSAAREGESPHEAEQHRSQWYRQLGSRNDGDNVDEIHQVRAAPCGVDGASPAAGRSLALPPLCATRLSAAPSHARRLARKKRRNPRVKVRNFLNNRFVEAFININIIWALFMEVRCLRRCSLPPLASARAGSGCSIASEEWLWRRSGGMPLAVARRDAARVQRRRGCHAIRHRRSPHGVPRTGERSIMCDPRCVVPSPQDMRIMFVPKEADEAIWITHIFVMMVFVRVAPPHARACRRQPLLALRCLCARALARVRSLICGALACD